MRAELLINMVMIAFTEEVQVEIGDFVRCSGHRDSQLARH
jgi:hypothetical protein